MLIRLRVPPIFWLVLLFTKISDVISIFFKFTLEKYTQAKMEIKVSNRIYLWSFFLLKIYAVHNYKVCLVGMIWEHMVNCFWMGMVTGDYGAGGGELHNIVHSSFCHQHQLLLFLLQEQRRRHPHSSWKTEVQGNAHLLSKNIRLCINIIALKTCLCNRSGQLWWGFSSYPYKLWCLKWA